MEFSVANDGTIFYFITNKDAPQYKLVSIDIAAEKREFKDVIPEDKGAHLEDVLAVADDKLVTVYKRNVSQPLGHLLCHISDLFLTPLGQRRNLHLHHGRQTP